MICPKCNSENVLVQQVQDGATSRTKTSVYSVHHGILWWCLIGSWWWIVDLFIRFMLICSTGGLAIFFMRKKKVGKEIGTTTTKIKNRTMATCQSCGYSWKI